MFKQINAIFTLLPKVMAVVMLVEPLFDATVSGSEKKEAALNVLRNLNLNENLIKIADDLIDVVVGVLNTFQIFSKKDPLDNVVADELLSVEAAQLKRAAAADNQHLLRIE
jgi:hypothetical protein